VILVLCGWSSGGVPRTPAMAFNGEQESVRERRAWAERGRGLGVQFIEEGEDERSVGTSIGH
jgi:hypothetical protein